MSKKKISKFFDLVQFRLMFLLFQIYFPISKQKKKGKSGELT